VAAPQLAQQCQETVACFIVSTPVKLVKLSKNYLHHTLFSCSASVKATAYKAIVRPILEHASPVWYLYSAKDVFLLKLIQRRAARWACGSRWSPVIVCMGLIKCIEARNDAYTVYKTVFSKDYL